MSTHLWGQLLELSPLGGRRYPGDRSGHAHRRTRMHRLQLSSLIHVAISEALKCSVIWIEKANAVTFPITFYWMILHSGLRKGDISIWQGKKKIFLILLFFFSPSPEMYYLWRQSLSERGRTARLLAALSMARAELWPHREQGQDRHGCSRNTVSSLLFILHVHLLGVNIPPLSTLS